MCFFLFPGFSGFPGNLFEGARTGASASDCPAALETGATGNTMMSMIIRSDVRETAIGFGSHGCKVLRAKVTSLCACVCATGSIVLVGLWTAL